MPSTPSMIQATISLLALCHQIQATPTPPPTTLTKRLGCYGDFSSDVSFATLHGYGYSGDTIQEVKKDIHTTCSLAAGKKITPTSPFWLCTNWEKANGGMTPYLQSCYDACKPKFEWSNPEEVCKAVCDIDYDMANNDGWNHIDWAIEVRDGQSEKVITYEACKAAFETELGGCANGSEQNHEGFWFRIDPNNKKCPA